MTRTTRFAAMSAALSGAMLGVGAFLHPSVAVAHPDHVSGGDFGLLHFASDPFHLGLSAAAVLLFVVARRSLLRRRATIRRR